MKDRNKKIKKYWEKMAFDRGTKLGEKAKRNRVKKAGAEFTNGKGWFLHDKFIGKSSIDAYARLRTDHIC